MKILLFSRITATAFLLLSVYSCQNQTTKQPAAVKDSSQLSPTMAGPASDNLVRTNESKKDTTPLRKTDLVIQEVQAQTLDSSTKIGKPGDMLLTFIGRGFVFTEQNPVVMAGDIKYDQTYSNEEGTELYVVVPAQESQRFVSQIKGELRIINPGNVAASVKQQGSELVRKMTGNEKVGLVYTKFGVARKKVDR